MSRKTIGWTAAIFLPTWFIRNLINLNVILEKVINLIGFEQKAEMGRQSRIHMEEVFDKKKVVQSTIERIIN